MVSELTTITTYQPHGLQTGDVLAFGEIKEAFVVEHVVSPVHLVVRMPRWHERAWWTIRAAWARAKAWWAARRAVNRARSTR